MVKCQVILDALEKLAPKKLAEEWDNPGLLLGSPSQEIHRLLVCLDIREETAERAAAEKFDMIVAHHPLIFRALKRIRTDLPEGRLIARLLSNNIAVFAAHTNLDITLGGVNDVLADRIGLLNPGPLSVRSAEPLEKLAVYVPREQAEEVRKAICQAGAGYIGQYSDCTFRVDGEGTFLPGAGTHPYIGQEGRLERVNETRVETIFPASIERHVIQALLKAHPYEEPAYDLYPLNNQGRQNSLGRVGELPNPMSFEAFCEQVKHGLRCNRLRFVHANDRPIKKVGLCSGSGAEFIDRAKILGCDAYVTGDVRYHDAQRAKALGLNVIDAGHFATEQPVVPVLADYLRDSLKRWSIEIIADDQSADFFGSC